MEEKPVDPWMTLADVMRLLDCGRLAVMTHVRNGEIFRRQTSAHRRYRRSDVEMLATKQQAQTA